MIVRIFNQAVGGVGERLARLEGQPIPGLLDLDTSEVEVDEFTVEAVMAALQARHWYFGEGGGTFAALRTDFERDSFGSLLVFNVREVVQRTAAAAPVSPTA